MHPLASEWVLRSVALHCACAVLRGASHAQASSAEAFAVRIHASRVATIVAVRQDTRAHFQLLADLIAVCDLYAAQPDRCAPELARGGSGIGQYASARRASGTCERRCTLHGGACMSTAEPGMAAATCHIIAVAGLVAGGPLPNGVL